MSFEVFWEALDDGLAKKLQDFLNERLARVVEKPAFLGAIQIEGLNFGNVPPNVTVVDFTQPRLEFYSRYSSPPSSSDMMLKLNVTFTSQLCFSIKTSLSLNYPTPSFMSLPVLLGVQELSLRGTCLVALIDKHVNFCFVADHGGPHLDMQLESQLGDLQKPVLKMVRNAEGFIIDQLRRLLREHVVFPQFVKVPLSR